MVNAALGMAVEQRGQGALIHTDHGPQFTSWTFSQNVRASGLVQSIGTVGDAYDCEDPWAGSSSDLGGFRSSLSRVV